MNADAVSPHVHRCGELFADPAVSLLICDGAVFTTAVFNTTVFTASVSPMN